MSTEWSFPVFILTDSEEGMYIEQKRENVEGN